MTRFWTEALAVLADLLPGGVPTVFLASLVLTILVVLLWYFWPRWLPPYRWSWFRRRERGERKDRRARFRPRWGRLRWRWRRKQRVRGQAETDDPYAPDELPDIPAAQLALTADDLATAGRYAEAVRERLRAMVRDLIERDVLPPTPGWTVTELATAAAVNRPALAAPMRAAVDVFSQIWYGLRPARAEDDQAMRVYAAAVGQVARESATPQPPVPPSVSTGPVPAQPTAGAR
jgi:hypothetical protein